MKPSIFLKLLPPIGLAVVAVMLAANSLVAQLPYGDWDVGIKCRGGEIGFRLSVSESSNGVQASLINGPEAIKVPQVTVTEDSIKLDIDHYDSVVELVRSPDDPNVLTGVWKKRRGPEKWSTMKCRAVPHVDHEYESPLAFLGRWAVKFSSSEDPAVAIFQKSQHSNQVVGTFLTTTGDYRFLAGQVQGDTLELSCFDGAHAFLFRAKIDEANNLTGDFWSSSAWHETWTAQLDPEAELPDDFRQTEIAKSIDWSALRFPNLDGKHQALDDPSFAGKARLIYVFGSWCPNCHDAGAYFATLEKKYGEQGLSILGLAFELTGDFDRDTAQIKKYLRRHGSTYPVLVAGMADKAEASKALPILDRIRSYPTTIFLDGNNQVTAIHTGFAGPATGEAFEKLKRKFEQQIEQNLGLR